MTGWLVIRRVSLVLCFFSLLGVIGGVANYWTDNTDADRAGDYGMLTFGLIGLVVFGYLAGFFIDADPSDADGPPWRRRDRGPAD